MAITMSGMHKQHRIHISRLFSGVWVASVVALGGKVEHIQGEFSTHELALRAAREYIDRQTVQKTA
jgi:hypothetical protein